MWARPAAWRRRTPSLSAVVGGKMRAASVSPRGGSTADVLSHQAKNTDGVSEAGAPESGRCPCRSALLVACFLHEITSSAPVSRVPRRTRTLTRTVRRPARPALHLTLHRPGSQVSGSRAAAVRGSRGSRLLPRCHQRTPWRRHRCRPCRPLSPPRPRRGRRRRSGPAAIGELPSRPCASPPLAASLPPQARAARPARPG